MTPTVSANDTVNHPPHYTIGRIEVIDAIEAWELGFHLGNVVKYVARAAHKGCFLEDLRKARWYLDRQIELAAQQAAAWDTQVREAQ
jgi:hypothetical protein